jgi:two-component sensor histidine kinase
MVGPDVSVGPKGASTISLLVHELTTNAIKYGALSNPTGQVRLNVAISKRQVEPVFSMNWIEIGGPPVAAPTKTGFGSKLIRMGLLGSGEVRSEYRPEGFNAEFTAPLLRLQGEGRLFDST